MALFEHYTDEAKRVLFFARWEAARRGMPSIDTLHLLLGLCTDEKSRVNESMNLRRWYVWFAESHCPFPDPQRSAKVDLPLNDVAKRIALRIAAAPPRWIDTSDILLELLREREVPGSAISLCDRDR